MPNLRPTAIELLAALAGGAAIGVAYAAGRRCALTSSNVSRRIAPGRPALGRAAQLGLGTLAALPGTRAGSPARAAALGAVIGVLAGREARAFSAAAHALATVVAQRVARGGLLRPRAGRAPRPGPAGARSRTGRARCSTR